MRLLTLCTATILLGLISAAPTTNDDTVLVTEDFFPDSIAVYTAQHDIVNILVPLNALNFEDDSEDEDSDSNTMLFFVEVDKNEKGERVDKGLYLLKNGNATKLLDHGREAAAANDETKVVYLGAKEGLFIYNGNENKVEKYGTVTDSIISIAKVNGSDIVYILTEDHTLYKVTENGTKKEKVESVVGAQQIVLDYENNLYYYTADKGVYILTENGPRKFEGLPQNPSFVTLLKPPFIIENGVPVIVNDRSYIVYSNGTVELGDFQLQVKPTAYSMEATLIQYYAHNKKIYEYNILTIIFGEMLDQLKTFLTDKSDDIQSIATRSRSDFKA